MVRLETKFISFHISHMSNNSHNVTTSVTTSLRKPQNQMTAVTVLLRSSRTSSWWFNFASTSWTIYQSDATCHLPRRFHHVSWFNQFHCSDAQWERLRTVPSESGSFPHRSEDRWDDPSVIKVPHGFGCDSYTHTHIYIYHVLEGAWASLSVETQEL